MTTLVHSYSSRHVLCVDHTKFENIGALKDHLIETKVFSKDACFFICNGKIVDDNDPVQKGVVYHTYPRILGGKGGFGSMLRSIGAQIEKTTNHEALRDLSGRRMRDVNNEKALKEWLEKQSEKEKEREQKRQERLARRRAMPQHKFDDPLYDQQRSQLAESQEQALTEGLKKAQAGPSTSTECRKRHLDDPTPGCSKQRKTTEWLGVDIDNLSDLDSDEDGSNSDRNTDSSSGQDSVKPDSDLAEIKSDNSSNDTDASVHDSYKTNRSENNIGSDQKNEYEQIHTESDESDKKIANHTESQVNTDIGSQSNNTNEVQNQELCHNETGSQDIDKKPSEDKAQVMADVSKQEPENGALDLDTVSSVDQLLELGLDKLKQELMSRGLKCGGTLEQRADRLFSVRGLTQDQIDPSLFAKNGGKNLKKKH